MPARLFAREPEAAKAEAIKSTLASLNSVLAEPIEDCLWIAPSGEPCLEARTPVELEAELALPGGNIFHRDLLWPFAEDEREVGTWGVETALRQRARVRRGRAARRRRQRHSGTQRGHEGALI